MGNCISMHKRKTVENNFNNNKTPTMLSELKTKWLVIFFILKNSQKGMQCWKREEWKKKKKEKAWKKGMIKKSEWVKKNS